MSIEERIAEVLTRHQMAYATDHCICGVRFPDFDDHGDFFATHVAAEVVAALGLRPDTANRPVLTYNDPPEPKRTNRVNLPDQVWATHFEFVPSTRWVTDYEPRVEQADPYRRWERTE